MGFSVSQTTPPIALQFGKKTWFQQFAYKYLPFAWAQRPVQNIDSYTSTPRIDLETLTTEERALIRNSTIDIGGQNYITSPSPLSMLLFEKLKRQAKGHVAYQPNSGPDDIRVLFNPRIFPVDFFESES